MGGSRLTSMLSPKESSSALPASIGLPFTRIGNFPSLVTNTYR